MDKVAVSNIAWPPAAEREALALAASLGFTGVEIAPGKTFDGWPRQDADVPALQAMLAGEGLKVVALQAILFGAQGVELFVSAQTRARLATHLKMVARLAGRLGARACVFGAPRQRDPGDLSSTDALAIAIEFFASISPVFESEGTCLAFEANDESYGCHFITRTAQAAALVRQIDRPGIRVQIDGGTVFLGNEPAIDVIDAARVAVHAHASEPELKPLGSTGADHSRIASALAEAGYDGWISVEMRATDAWQANLENAARLMSRVYCAK
jgi:sugar phosphate isomerase/epimerase